MEVTATLCFNTPCLGHVRKSDTFNELQRNPDGEVIFLPTWWKKPLRDASQALNMAQGYISKIFPALDVIGDVEIYDRQWGKKGQVTRHEAFLAGSEIIVSFMLPRGLSLEEFREILEMMGAYFGMSPYGWDRDFGKFRVVEIRNGGKRQHQESRKPTEGEPGHERDDREVPEI